MSLDAQPVLAPDELLARALPRYDLMPPVEVELIRRGFNDHYLVSAGGGKLVLRVYLNGKYYIRGPEDLAFELELLAFLRGRGLPVAAPVASRSGKLLEALEADGITRHLALFEFAHGEEVRGKAIEPATARRLGEIVAGLHRAADDFASGRPPGRYRLDAGFLVDRPLAVLRGVYGDRAAFLEPFAARLRERLSTLPTEGGAFGLIHGDLHSGNLYRTPEGGITVFDFDHCAYGWRAYDLVPLWMSLGRGERAAEWEALIEGYRSVRDLGDAELEAMPVLGRARELWDPGDYLAVATEVWRRPPTDEQLGRMLEGLEGLTFR